MRHNYTEAFLADQLAQSWAVMRVAHPRLAKRIESCPNHHGGPRTQRLYASRFREAFEVLEPKQVGAFLMVEGAWLIDAVREVLGEEVEL